MALGMMKGESVGEGRKELECCHREGGWVREGRDTFGKFLQDLEASMGEEWHVATYAAP